MISLPLMKRDWKDTWKLTWGVTVFLGIYTAVMIGLYDVIKGMEIQTVPQSFASYLCMALGIHMGVLSDLNQFLMDMVYGFLFLLLPMIFEIVAARRMMIKLVRNGMMTWILSTPNDRGKIGGTQALFLILSVAIQTVVTTVTGVLCMSLLSPQEIDIFGYVMMNTGAFMLHFLISGICFLISSSVNGNKSYYRLTALILGLFFLLHLIGNLGGFFEYAKFGTIFSLYQPQKILDGENRAYLFMMILFISGILFYWGGVQRFKKKNL
ncbi:MAG: hypothetical protein Q4B90_02135 [Eubacteriales bacterium]|nr:hypothetical protein [Eubacteriales bacterium]